MLNKGDVRMNRYIFGLCNNKSRQWIEQRWRNYGSKNMDNFIDDVLCNAGEHILPFLTAENETTQLIRKRHLDNLSKVLTHKELKETLQLELKTIIHNE